MFNIKKSLLCISAISCMSLYADPIEVDNPITIGKTTTGKAVATGLTNTTYYNYWEDSNTYVFNRSSNNGGKNWIANKPVTIDEDYTLKLIKTGYTDYKSVLYCDNTFANDGNVIIDNYGGLLIDYDNKTTIDTSTNNGTIKINNGRLVLYCNVT